MVSFCLLILSVRSAKSGTISDRRALACSPPKKSSTCCTNVILKPGRMDWILCIAQSLRISDTGTDVSVRFLLVPMFLSFKHTCTSYWDCSLLILEYNTGLVVISLCATGTVNFTVFGRLFQTGAAFLFRLVWLLFLAIFSLKCSGASCL
jgi:hypothetical protein